MARIEAIAIRCCSPPDSRSTGRSASRRGAGDHHRLLGPGCDLSRRVAEVLEPEGDLAPRPPHHQLAFGVLEHKSRYAGDLAWIVVAGVHALCGHPPLQAAAVEVRDEAGDGAQER